MNRIKSAGKHQFSPYLSCQRIRSVQNLLKQNESNKDAPQAILAVLGIDGKFNEGCREFANYLTFGFFTARQLELEKAGLEDEDIEDVVIFIRRDSVSLYCGAYLYNFLLPYVAHWKNLQIYCRAPQEDEQDRDTDVEEMYKVKSFISMIQGCSIIGIPFLGSSTIQSMGKDGVLSIEKWPLIQSYASTDIGCGKFFTLDYTAINVREQVLPLYNQCGPFVLEKTVGTSYPLFVRHWNEALTVINNAVKNKSILGLKEDQVLDPLQCYYKHGQLSKPKQNKKAPPPDSARKPFILFGTHSAEKGKDTKPFSVKSGAKKGKSTSNHMTMQCVSPNGPLLCTRTYFFKSQGKVDAADKEFNNLVHLYTTCIEGASSAVNEFAATLSAPKAERKAIEHLLAKGMSCGLVFDAKCSVTACDKLGKKVQIAEGKLEATMNVIKVSAENVKTSHGGDVIGSIIFSDTFMVSSFEMENSEGSSDRDTVCNVLTSDIPIYIEWPTETVKSDGTFSEDDPLALCKDMTICSTSDLYSPPCVAMMQFNQDGSMLLSAKNMNEIVLKRGVQYFDSPTPGEVCLVVINFDLPENAPLWGQVPAHFRGNVNTIPDIELSQPSKCVILAMLPGTQAYKEFYAVVAHHVQNVPMTPLTLKKMKYLSSDLITMYNSVQDAYKYRRPITKETFTKSTALEQPAMKDFVSHLTVATVAGDLPIPDYAVAPMLKKKNIPLEKHQEDEKVTVTIISGLPCSGTDQINQQLVSLNKEKVRWVVIRPNPGVDTTSTLDRSILEQQLSQAVTNKKVARPSAAARKKLRIIILAVGVFDLCEIIQCVTQHSDISVREQLSIGAVTTCIWPELIHYSERQNFPKYFSQLMPGIVSNIAFITPEKEVAGEMDKNLAVAQSLVRCVNKQAAFLTCPGGKLIRKTDFDLVLADDLFSSTKMIQERSLLRPDLSIGQYDSGHSVPSMSKVTLEFSQPLIKGAFSARVRSLRSSVTHPQPIGSVCFTSGCVSFTEAPAQDYDVSFSSVMHAVEMIPRVAQSALPAPPTAKAAWTKSKPYFLDFYGINLDEEALKDWLRKCGRQKPSKKCHKTKGHLTKDEIQMIHEENCTRRLPEGHFYNGSFYVSLFDNKKVLHHPNMQKFVDEYLQAENEEIDEYNAEIDRQNIKDIFD